MYFYQIQHTGAPNHYLHGVNISKQYDIPFQDGRHTTIFECFLEIFRIIAT